MKHILGHIEIAPGVHRLILSPEAEAGLNCGIARPFSDPGWDPIREQTRRIEARTRLDALLAKSRPSRWQRLKAWMGM